MSMRRYIHESIDAERDRQDEIHGGSLHDQGHTRGDWLRFICEEFEALGAHFAELAPEGHDHALSARTFRRGMVRVAAIATAAVEADCAKFRIDAWELEQEVTALREGRR